MKWLDRYKGNRVKAKIPSNLKESKQRAEQRITEFFKTFINKEK